MSKFSKLETAKAKLVIADPFYGTIALETPYIVDRNEKTAATDGVNIYYNPEFIESLPLQEVIGVIKHECEHIARQHPWRLGTRDPEGWNTACDAIINDSLDAEGNTLPEGVIKGPKGCSKQYSEEQYYTMQPKGGKGGGGGQGQGKGQGQNQPGSGQGSGGQQKPQPKDPLAGDVRRPPPGQHHQDNARALVTRARNVAKARGMLSADAEEEINKLLEAKVGWKEKLLRFCQELGEDDISWARPDRRFVSQGIYMPGKFSDDVMGVFVAVFDTSCSMSMREIEQGMSESTRAIQEVKPTKFVSIYCDSKVKHVDEFDSPSDAEVAKSFKRHGHGGTDMTEALDYIDEHIQNVAAVVVFTDGDTPYGEQRTYPVLWGITHARNLGRPDWGEVVHVEFDDDE